MYKQLKDVDYKLLEASLPHILAEEVQRAFWQGWSLYGSPFSVSNHPIHKYVFYQAVVKERQPAEGMYG